MKMLSIAIVLLGFSGALAQAADSDLRLTYDKPASGWTEALPLGNGRIGVMDFGGTREEHLQVSEGTLWGGGPHDYVNPGAHAHLQEIQQLIFAGRVDAAQKLSESLMGQPSRLMPYQPFCDIRLRAPGGGQITDYRRSLNLEEAIARTEFTVGTTRFRREAFVSFPDQVLVIRISASEPGQITFALSLDSPQPGVQVVSTAQDTLRLTGQIQPRQNPPSSWNGSWNEPGMRFAAVLKVLTEGGSVRAAGPRLEIAAADAVTILFSNATSFRSYEDIEGDAVGAAQGYAQGAANHSYPQLLERHERDFQTLFSRTSLHLGETHSTQTTDRRIQDFAHDEDPSLPALYFEYGRYLLIASSRAGGQPANLQGIWNDQMVPPWGSKWTTNINLEMNYWQADSGDLWETETPLWDLIKDLRKTGARTARVEYHSNGWVLHHNTDLWRATAPVDGFWGIWPMGEAWLANQMWDHYEFSGDREFLEHQAYPAMKEAALFVLGFLVEAPAGTPFAGRLVTNPSTSPENSYLLNGKPASLTYAATMDIELIQELFENCRKAAAILGVDAALRSQLEHTAKRLPPLQIGRRGQLQEWIEDYPEAEPQHRHVSHLYALYPGHAISPATTPDLAAAAMKTLALRGDGGTGWAQVWRAALWARLEQSEQAYGELKRLIQTSTLPNLLDRAGPPFQIDGNLGAPAAITEMLVQSTAQRITVLPALPLRWPSGGLFGVRVRGGGRVDITWRAGRLSEISLRTDRQVTYEVSYRHKSVQVSLQPGKPQRLDGDLRELTP